MTSAQQNILASIRRNKRRQADDSHQPNNTIPIRTLVSTSESILLFEQMLDVSATTYEHIGRNADIAEAVAQFLQHRGLTKEVYVNLDDGFSECLRHTVSQLSLSTEVTETGPAVSVVGAFQGIAETGTLVLLSGKGRSTAANFLPDTLVVILPVDRIVATQESMWRNLRVELDTVPRTINLVTGPSRTGDIEQKIVIGAHGPRKLHVILVAESE